MVRHWKAFVATIWFGLFALTSTHAQDPTVVDLPSRQWVDTGIDVHKGDSLGVTLNARRASARAKRQRVSPTVAGTPGSEPLQNAPASAPTLTGRIGAVTFAVTSHCVAPATGRLFLRVNTSAISYGGEPETVRARISYISRAGSLETPKPQLTTVKPVENTFVPLPNVVGMKFAVASRSLKEYGVTPRRQRRSSSRPRGEVVDQSPAPGVDRRTIKVVILGVSDGSLAQPKAVSVKTVKPIVVERTARPIESAPLPRIAVATPPPIAAATPRPIATATARPRVTAVTTSAATTASSRGSAPPKATSAPRSLATRAPAPLTSTSVLIAIPSVVGFNQRDAIATIASTKLRAVYRGKEASRLPLGQVTRTDPAAGTRLKRGSLVGYWVSAGAVNTTVGTPPRVSGFNWWLIAGGLIAAFVAAFLGFFINNRIRVAKVTRSLLSIEPSLELDGPTNFDGGITMEGPAVGLQASVEQRGISFDDSSGIVTRKEHHG